MSSGNILIVSRANIPHPFLSKETKKRLLLSKMKKLQKKMLKTARHLKKERRKRRKKALLSTFRSERASNRAGGTSKRGTSKRGTSKPRK